MPEFFDEQCTYQAKAQPYLAAIARGVKDDERSRAYLLKNTAYEHDYANAKPLWREQWQRRDPNDSMLCPFWTNYFYEKLCDSCNCRIERSKATEIDAMFFLQSADQKTLAIHIEMKRDREHLSIGQAEAYRPRATCYRDQRRVRKGLLVHNHFITVLFCGVGTNIALAQAHFDRVITHENARSIFPNYPS